MLRKNPIAAFAAPALALILSYSANAQDSTKSTTITGSVDAYYRYNFNNAKDPMAYNNYTSFTNSQNSFELGMASVKVEHNFGKVTGVLDLGFGNRAAEFSYTDVTTSIDDNFDMVTSPNLLAAVKQAYISYSPSDVVKFTMGKWGTHVGYELLDPQLNRNYSMSYMFSYGPFSHTGIKADFTLSDHFGLMVGVANPTDYVTASFAKKFIIGQISGTSDKVNAYLNFVAGKDFDEANNFQVGLTATATVSDKFSVGYDGTVKSYKPMGGSSASWWGSAIYLNFDPSSMFGITVRGEYFDDKKGVAGFATSLFDATLSFDIKPTENILIIPEFRLDSAKDQIFFKNSDYTKSTGTFLLAAIFYF